MRWIVSEALHLGAGRWVYRVKCSSCHVVRISTALAELPTGCDKCHQVAKANQL